MGELAGTKLRRSYPGNTTGLPMSDPSFVTSVLGPMGHSSVQKSGYRFQIFLPGKKKPITDDGTSKALPFLKPKEQKIIDVQERLFRAYGWPQKHGNTGIRCFVVDQAGEY